jgi:serine/threonine protein kinase
MDPERWRKIEQLYHLALEQEPAQQNRFLAEACPDDAELREEVESLLAQSRSTEHLVDQKAWAAADDLAATQTILTTGARLGPYQILGLLGAGGMGRVYRGLDTRLLTISKGLGISLSELVSGIEKHIEVTKAGLAGHDSGCL